MNEKLQQIAQKWKYQPENINNGGFELALKEAYKAGRDAQRESDVKICKKIFHESNNLAASHCASYIENNTGEL